MIVMFACKEADAKVRHERTRRKMRLHIGEAATLENTLKEWASLGPGHELRGSSISMTNDACSWPSELSAR
jgi:hypothetical protein